VTALVDLGDLEPKALALRPFDRVDAGRVIACPDLVSVGMLGEAARRARHGDRVTWVSVCPFAARPPAERGQAGEVRITAAPASADDAVHVVRDAVVFAAGTVLTGFSLAALVDLCGGDHLALAELARSLRVAGLEAVASVPVDRFAEPDGAAESMRAARQGGLRVARLTVERAAFDVRLDLIERAAAIAQAAGHVHAFAPLPEVDPAEQPSTGYDDVKTVALARLCTTIPAIQVSWALYGPKLAQVAIAYGASDIDGVPAADAAGLGPRRAPRADIERQIRAAFAEPAERNGRFELVP
jgi:aminodeoxyfutalosine synthase